MIVGTEARQLTAEQAQRAADPEVLADLNRVVSRGVRRGLDADDVRSFLHGELVRIAYTFDPSRGVTWPAYARQRLYLGIYDFQRQAASRGFTGATDTMRRGKPRKRTDWTQPATGPSRRVYDPESGPLVVSLDRPLTPDSTIPASALLADHSRPAGELEESIEEAAAWLACLPSRERGLIARMVLEGHNWREVGEDMGLGKTRIYQIYNLGIERLATHVKQRLGWAS